MTCAGCPTPKDSSLKSTPDAPAAGEFTFQNHLIFVKASINDGEPVWALIDTGANNSAIDFKYAQDKQLSLSDETTVHGSAGKTQARSTTLRSLAINGAAVPDTTATAYPLLIMGPDGRAIALIVGYPYLKHFAVSVDYVHHQLILHRHSIPTAHSIPMRLDQGIPRVKLLLNGKVATEFRIDTGASLFDAKDVFCNITSSVRESLKKQGFDPKPEFTLGGSGVGGPIELPVIRLESLQIGDRRIDRPCAIVQPPVGIFADPAVPGFVANYTLESLGTVTFDYLGSALRWGD
jgi:predicted aspartyl protease